MNCINNACKNSMCRELHLEEKMDTNGSTKEYIEINSRLGVVHHREIKSGDLFIG